MRADGLWWAAALLLAGALAAHRAEATTLCVTSGSATQLDDDMQYWVHASDQTVYIHLEQGVYNLKAGTETISGTNYYDQGPYSKDSNTGNATLHLVGGFVPGTNPPCSKREVDASNTTISGNATISGLFIEQDSADVLIDGITFRNFAHGVSVTSIASSSVTLRNIALIDNGNGDYNDFPAMMVFIENPDWYLGGATSTVRVENCLIHGNNANGLEIDDRHGGDRTEVTGCTIADNAGYGLTVGRPGNPSDYLNGSFKALNTIFRNNALADVFVQSGGNQPTIEYSNVASISGAATTSHNQNTDPKFIDEPGGNYDLDPSSPLINIGASSTLVTGGYATTDIRGRTRVVGGRIDLGAYESLVNPKLPQIVTTAGDSTGNTLRAAITAANNDPNPTTITFDVPGGGCPTVLAIDSLLPDITSDITIDGYTQPGALPNDTAPGYDGNICVWINGNGFDHAFTTSGGGRLTVRGIEFEHFSGAAIRLATGSGHIVAGNIFVDTTAGVWIEGAATASEIGSFAFGDRNTFIGMSDGAVKITDNGSGNHLIQGNYIGYGANGTNYSSSTNRYGIYISNSASNEISYNFVGGSQLNAIRLTGAGAAANRVIENAIGIAPADDAAEGGGYGSCNPICLGGFAAIEVVAGAHDNSIGANEAAGGSNYIANNDGPGVAIESTAGTGNRVYGNNLIHDNNGYLAVDLGLPGPNANDVGDGDFGGNNLQNYPIMGDALRIEANVIRLSGLLPVQNPGPAQVYRLDFFWTDTCVAGDVLGPRGEFKGYVGFLNLYAAGTTNYSTFSNADIAITGKPPGLPGKTYYLSATATDASGNTSEPGPCSAYIDDYIFSNGFN